MIIQPKLSEFQKADGTANIYIYVYDRNTQKKSKISTEYYVKPSEWDNGKVKRINADFINSKIRLLITELEGYALKNDGVTPAELKRWYEKKDETVKESINMVKFTSGMIQEMRSGKLMHKGRRFSEETIGSYEGTENVLIDYFEWNKGVTPWREINSDFYSSFVNWMREAKEYGDNTVGKHVKNLKAIMKRALNKHHQNLDFMNFTVLQVESDGIYLTEEEMKLWINAVVPPHLKSDQGRFYLSYNFFLRFGDSLDIDKRNVKVQNGIHVATFIHSKTRQKTIIPLLPKSLELLKEFKWSLPETTNQETNWKLKEIGKIAGISTETTIMKVDRGKVVKQTGAKFNFITSHTARRSMATNYYLSMVKSKNIDLKSLQLMGGWKNIAILEKYLKIDKDENASRVAESSFFK